MKFDFCRSSSSSQPLAQQQPSSITYIVQRLQKNFDHSFDYKLNFDYELQVVKDRVSGKESRVPYGTFRRNVDHITSEFRYLPQASKEKTRPQP